MRQRRIDERRGCEIRSRDQVVDDRGRHLVERGEQRVDALDHLDLALVVDPLDRRELRERLGDVIDALYEDEAADSTAH